MAPLVHVGRGDVRENVIIGTLNVNAPPTLPAVDPLRPHVAYEAMHDSGEVDAQGDCHPGTRIAIQGIIKRWAEDPRPNTLVNLMIGAAGAGKSAIMRTISKVLEQEGKLLGGFFCFRSSKRRSDGSLVVPTLVAQLVKRIPHLRLLVHQAFEEEGGLLTKAMDIQALKLIIEPLNSIDPNKLPQRPYIVLLDGLDEINGIAAQQAIIKVFAYINRHLVSPLRFLIASRPEPPILEAFDELMGGRWSRLELDESLNPNNDIDIFYINHFQKIRDRNPHLPLGWPGVPVRRILVEKGSGKFIFASVVVGVIDDPLSPLSPPELLDLVLEVTKRGDLQPLERLDLLYVTVLNQIPEIVRPQVLRILAVILGAGNTLQQLSPTPRLLDALFCMPSGTTRRRLSNLHSVLEIPADDDRSISPQHATLGDFIFDEARSEHFGFHVDKTQLVEDSFLRITASLQLNPDKMADVFDDFFDFFGTQMEAVDRRSLPLQLAQNLLSYNPSSLSPLALTLFAAPLAWMVRSSGKYKALRDLSRSIIEEVDRRARLYWEDYGTQGLTLLALFSMTVRLGEIFGMDISKFMAWYAIGALCSEVKKSVILAMDGTSGLTLMTYYVNIPTNRTSSWRGALARNGWLCSYLHLLTRPDVVADISRLQKLPDSDLTPRRFSMLAHQWERCLPFNQSTISGLRATLSSARPECDDEDINIFLGYIKHYIHNHWNRRWRIPSLFLLHRDWKRWRERATRARRARQ